MNRSQKKTLLILLAAVAVLIAALLIVRSAKERSARQAEEEAAAEEAAGVITEEAAYSALSYDNGTTALSFALDEEGNWTWPSSGVRVHVSLPETVTERMRSSVSSGSSGRAHMS